ncbi:MAG: choice-of-anchor L domain-containing protein [Gemmataceae bacterium]|nr:choice-of-anchor L domain-containing protein [Gemmataceae bacterium]
MLSRSIRRTAFAQKGRRLFLGVERLEDRLTPVTTVTDLTGGLTPTALVQTLLGQGVQVSNVVYRGTNVSAGRFTGGQNSVGFDEGIILSSGAANAVIGNNNNSSGGFANNVTSGNAAPGDPDLNALVAPATTFDATVLEFDFIPAGNTLTFKYVFASEEYPDFVGTAFNDVFAFFLNGQNVARIPNTNIPVSINNVNAQSNSQFFVDNYSSNTPARQITMDGLTVVLTVTANVNAGQVNRIKLAIADTADSALDSNVFIQSGSFTSLAPQPPVVKIYNPVRFRYNKATDTFEGIFTVLNKGTSAIDGPTYILLKNLPNGVTLAGGSGAVLTGAIPYLTIANTIPPGKTAKLKIVLNNPLKQPLSPFYIVNNLEFSTTAPAPAN